MTSFRDRLLRRLTPEVVKAPPPPDGAAPNVPSAKSGTRRRDYFDITDTSARLEAVGESHYQEALREAVGGTPTEYVTCEVVATLIAEPDNPYDNNAIAVHVGSSIVGYLSRRDAGAFRGFFGQLGTKQYRGASCRAVICGGGVATPSLGIFLRASDPGSAESRLLGSDAPLPPVAVLVEGSGERTSSAAISSNNRDVQMLWCERGGHRWERPPTRGRPPRNCPDHP